MQLSLATYNVHGCVGRGGRFDPKRIEAVLRELDADVVALQELRWNPDAALDQLQDFGDNLGYQTVAGPTLLRGDGHYGNAVLTRLPIVDLQLVDISQPRRERRGAIDVQLQLPAAAGAKPLRVIATHLGLSPAERRAQIQLLLKRLGQPEDSLVVLMGDLNEWFAWGRPLRRLQRHFGTSHRALTWPAIKPVFALDRIWVHPAASLKAVSTHRSVLSVRASDHLPLRAVLQL